VRDVSPFLRRASFDFAVFTVTATVTLPDDDRAGRRQLHAAAQRHDGAAHHLLAVRDDELV
jgi:hypothetical protein